MDYGKGKCITKKIKVYGIVQGVGFRPLVYRIAKSLKIKGNVRNVGGYVEIIVQAEEKVLNIFLDELKAEQSGGCEIIRLETEEYPQAEYEDFIIVHSKMSEETSIIPPDLPVCEKCSEELYNNKDRRFENPFISCMSCGPRYTIIEELPYDRQNTTMKDFDLCPACLEEYISPDSRRFHAQTISCDDCGPYLIYKDCAVLTPQEEAEPHQNRKSGLFPNRASELPRDREALVKAIKMIKQGGIIAVKGIGGYHFVCSPFMEETVIRLRQLKGREEKPFAVMFPSLGKIKEYCIVSEEESLLLKTSARPIVLLYLQNNTMAPSVNKNSIYCGAFLPYTPLQLLLTAECGPLIMTSANISDQPVIREDEILMSLKSEYLSGILYNKRRIIRSVDDSVAKVIDNKPQLIRRSRGYVPYPVFLGQEHLQAEHKLANEIIFAAGGDLKASFCLYKDGNAVVSQYFGDLVQVSVLQEYKNSYTDLCRLLKLEPTLAVCDLHPNYASSGFAKALKLPVLAVQHHHAHVASVMAEHELKERVIGVAFDGTGYGTDGNIWGGEFLICEGAGFVRAAHLSYQKILGGDRSMKDAKKTASCFLIGSGMEEYLKDDRSDIIKSALKQGINTVLTSSMGRLFDAVASILNIGQDNRYEGECAALLEREAVLALRNNLEPSELSFTIEEKNEILDIDPRPLLQSLCNLREDNDTGCLALGFHYAVAEMIAFVCERLRTGFATSTVALSGGVFQNSVLTEQTLKLLRQKGFEVFVNMAVPPNDGAISLGQTYIAMMTDRSNV
jgi:hydrogenase maturation protein HypF